VVKDLNGLFRPLPEFPNGKFHGVHPVVQHDSPLLHLSPT
jgi:hypothetical protein